MRASIVIAHSSLEMNASNDIRVTDALIKVFGSDERARVIAQNPELRKASWRNKFCFGSFGPEYTILCSRDQWDRLHVWIDLTQQARFQDACSATYRGVKSALSGIGINARLESLEVLPPEGVRAVVIGLTGVRAHFGRGGVIEQVLVGSVTAAVVGLGGWLFWSDQAASLWSGAAPGLGLGAWAVLVVFYLAISSQIRWLPAR